MRKTPDSFPIILVFAVSGLTYFIQLIFDSLLSASIMRWMESSLGVPEAELIAKFSSIGGALSAAVLIVAGLYIYLRRVLVSQLQPDVHIIYDQRIPRCRSREIFTSSGGSNSTNAIVYRIEVENISEDTVTNCEGYLTEVAFEEEPSDLGPMNLSWSGKYPLETKIDLRPKVQRYLDLVIIYENNQVTITTPGWPPNNKHKFFSRTGSYRFAVAIVGDKLATLPLYKLQLNYTGDWQTSTMEPSQPPKK